jgi:hypothetical protein
MLAHAGTDAFVQALLEDMPEAPPDQARIVAANRRGRSGAPA